MYRVRRYRNRSMKHTVPSHSVDRPQLKGMEQENQHLGQMLSALRQRCQVGAEARAKDVETENRTLHESICETSAKLNKIESERKQLRELPVGPHVHSQANTAVFSR